MARLRTDGAVFGKEVNNASLDYENHRGIVGTDSPFSSGTTEMTIESSGSIVRTGERYCYKIIGTTRYRNQNALAGVLGRHYYFRQYLRISSAVAMTGNAAVMQVLQGSNQVGVITVLGTGRYLRLRNGADVQIGPDGTAIDLDRWYRMEMHVWQQASPTSSNGTLEARVYDDTDTLIWSEGSTATDVRTTALDGLRSGNMSATNATVPFYVSTIGVNDDQGGAGQISWLGAGIVVAMIPTSWAFSTPCNWTDGDGTAIDSASFAAVDSIPPVGQVIGSATVHSQINNAVASTTNPNSEAYFTTGAFTDSLAAGGAGMDANDIVRAARVVARVGSTSTSTQSMAVQGFSNPAIAQTIAVTNAATAGDDTADPPVGWKTISTNFANEPLPTLGSGAVLKVKRNNASAGVTVSCDLLALIVDYQPVAPAAATDSYAEEVAADSPVFWVPMQEASGTAAEDVIAPFNGTYYHNSGGTDSTAQGSWTAGGVALGGTGPITGDPANDGCATFERANRDMVYFPHANVPSLGDNFSVELWFKQASRPSGIMVFNGKGQGPPAIVIQGTGHAQPGRIDVACGNIGYSVLGTVNISDTTIWHHVVFTKSSSSGTAAKLYIDGIDRTGTVTSQTFSNDADEYMLIGADSPEGAATNRDHFDGSMAHFALYTTVLSEARVAAHYNSRTVAPPVGGAPERELLSSIFGSVYG